MAGRNGDFTAGGRHVFDAAGTRRQGFENSLPGFGGGTSLSATNPITIMKTLLRILPLVCIAIGFFTSTLRAEDGIEQPAGNVIVPDGLKAEQVQKAILLAGTGRGWTVKAKDEGKVVLFLEHGGWRSQLTLTYDTKEISISSNSGKLDRHGNVKKHAVPETWVNFLKQDITKNLGMAAYGK
jgi:hypothetical protein